ncbi:MAG: hypothetical protein JSR33_07635 [Proteobacteria bacterium]|nr:hypothetical protein [Pseudomonadota bacterium]
MRCIVLPFTLLKLTRYLGVSSGRRSFSSATGSRPLKESYQFIPLMARHCLSQLNQDWSRRQPLQGKTVLLNMHLTTITLMVIEILRQSQARLEVIVAPELAQQVSARQAVLQAGIPLLEQIPEHKRHGYYDIIYDCGAGMRKLTPRLGMVELTQTQPDWYADLDFPVITVDQSLTKSVETGLGTGDSVVRLIYQLAREALTLTANCSKENIVNNPFYWQLLFSLLQVNQLFSAHRFIIFGYGKVGSGIAQALENAGTPKQNIFIVEVELAAYLQTIRSGYPGLWLNEDFHLSQSIQRIKSLLPQSWAVITATGQAGALSRYFKQEDFVRVPLLLNMGTYDEFGQGFAPERILNNKKPANFMLEYPTEVRYLDPIFSLFLQGGEELLDNSKLAPGLNKISLKRDHSVLSNWLRQHGDILWQHSVEQKQTEKFIQNLRQHSIFSSALYESHSTPISATPVYPAASCSH